MKKFFCLFIVLSFSFFVEAKYFVHPGILFTQSDLDKVKTNQNSEPWKSALTTIKNSPSGSLNYAMRGPFPYVSRGGGPNGSDVRLTEHGRDAQACYTQAVLGYITGDERYTQKAITIINAWSRTLERIDGGEVDLVALFSGIQSPLWAMAGDILAHTGTAWAKDDILQAKGMLTNIFVPAIYNLSPENGANFSTSCLFALFAIAVFTENTALFDRAWNAFISTAGCPNDFSLLKNIGANGQNVESGRDQVHSWSSYEMLSGAAYAAFIQGKNSFELGDYRLKTGVEYWCKYNLGGTVPWDRSIYRCRPGWGPWNEISSVNRGIPDQQGSICNMVYRNYQRMGIDAPYTKEMADRMGNTIVEPNGRNGWGAPFILDHLLYIHPGKIELKAEENDNTILKWTMTGVNLASQDIYRGKSDDFTKSELLAPDIQGTTYTDLTSDGVSNYRYWIKTTDKWGDVLFSNMLEVFNRLEIPSVPDGLTAQPGNGYVVLNWNNANEHTRFYNIKRSSSILPLPYEIIATSEVNRYTDMDVKNGSTYYYVVSAANSVGESANSNRVTGMPVLGASYYWPLNEQSGTTSVDVWNNTILTSNASWTTTGKFNGAANFNGSNNYLTLPQNITSNLTNSTFSFWVYLNNNTQWTRIFNFGTNVNTSMYITSRDNNGYLRYSIRNAGSAESHVTTTKTINTGQWYHIALTLSGGKSAILYVNGEEVGIGTLSYGPADLGNTTNNYFGRPLSSDPYLNGRVDDIRIYNGVLGIDQIKMLYQTSAQEIQFEALPEKNTGDKKFKPDVTATSGLDVTLKSSDSNIAEIINGEIRLRKAGTVDITAHQLGNLQYAAAPSVSRPLVIVQGTNGIHSNRADNFSILPNPVSDYLIVNIITTNPNETALFTIYSLEGRKLKTVKCNASKNSISVKNLPKGLFIGEVNIDNKIQTVKIVKE